MRMTEHKKTQAIFIPPLTGEEETPVNSEEAALSKDEAPLQEEVIESVDSSKKVAKELESREKGVTPDDLLTTQKLLNRRNPSPKLARHYTTNLRRYISNYGSKGGDEKLYIKVDTKLICFTNILFNDDKDKEHSFSITSHVINTIKSCRINV